MKLNSANAIMLETAILNRPPSRLFTLAYGIRCIDVVSETWNKI